MPIVECTFIGVAEVIRLHSMKYITPRELIATIISIIAVATLTVFSTCSHAAESPAFTQVSLGMTVWRGSAPEADFQFVLPASVFPHAYADFGVTLIANTSYEGLKVNSNSILRAGMLWRYAHLSLGAGLAYINNPWPYNGEHENFALTGGYEFVKLPITIQYMHFSDAGQTRVNIGRDVLEIGWRF